MKYLGASLTEYVQNFYVENCSTLTKEIFQNLNEQRYTIFMIRSVNMLKISVLLKLKFLSVSWKYFFCRYIHDYSKTYMKKK